MDQTKQWSDMLKRHLEEEHEMKQLHVQQQSEIYKTLMEEAHVNQEKELENRQDK